MTNDEEKPFNPNDHWEEVVLISEEVCELVRKVRVCAKTVRDYLVTDRKFLDREDTLQSISSTYRTAANSGSSSTSEPGTEATVRAICELAGYFPETLGLSCRLNVQGIDRALAIVYEEVRQRYPAEFRSNPKLFCVHRVLAELRTITRIARKPLVDSGVGIDDAENGWAWEDDFSVSLDTHLDIVLDCDPLNPADPPIWVEMQMCRSVADVALSKLDSHLASALSAPAQKQGSEVELESLLQSRPEHEHKFLQIVWEQLRSKREIKSALLLIAVSKNGVSTEDLHEKVWKKLSKKKIKQTSVRQQLSRFNRDCLLKQYTKHGFELGQGEDKLWRLNWNLDAVTEV